MAHTSYSQITSWLHCGEQYRLTRVAGAPEWPSWWLAGGKAVHTTTEVYDLSEPWDQRDFDVDVEFAKAWANEPTRHTAGRFKDAEPRSSRNQDEAWWLDNGPKMVHAWIEWRKTSGYQIAVINDTLAVELAVTATIAGTEVKGFIDRVMVDPQGNLMIVDLKTGARTPDSGLQLGVYRVMLQQTLGIDVGWGGYFMNRKADLLGIQPLDKYDQKYIERFVGGFMKAKQNNIYLPSVSAMCKGCGVAYACWAVGGEDAAEFEPTIATIN